MERFVKNGKSRGRSTAIDLRETRAFTTGEE